MPRAAERVEPVVLHADAGVLLDVDVHHDRLDVDLAPRLIEPGDDVAHEDEVVLGRRDEDRVGGLLGADPHRRLEHRQRLGRSHPAPAPPPATPPASASLIAGDDLLRVGVLERDDVDLPLVRGRDVDPLDEREHARVGRLAPDDDERVRLVEATSRVSRAIVGADAAPPSSSAAADFRSNTSSSSF